ncbi:DciA family protein [Streptomyces sp. NPDC056982]|uniref:DciA family protein n=1 Tax=Streptomyces sp. NPDC056982 TaxID=3345986 RepID=UPI003639B26D
MSDQPAASGADLARQALAHYKATAQTKPAGGGNGRRTTRRRLRPGDRRDPVGLGAVLKGLSIDASWDASLSGGSIVDQWASLCPQYATTVQPVAYDTDRGRLDLRPATQAYAAQLRLLGGQLAKQINDKMGRDVVRSIRVLPVAALTTGTPATAQPTPTPQSQAAVGTRETASPGYRHNLELALAHRPEHARTVPLLREALECQNAVLENREPEVACIDAVAELDRLPDQSLDRGEAIRRAAIARKYARGDGPVRRAFDVA